MSSIGPQLPPHLLATLGKSNTSDDEDTTEEPSANPSDIGSIGPQLPPTHAMLEPSAAEDDSDDDYAPALPPGFSQHSQPSILRPAASTQAPTTSGRAVGPTPPAQPARYDDDESDEEIGPSPFPVKMSVQKDAVAEFREREENRRKAFEACLQPVACVLCANAVEQDAAKPKKLEREEWMLKPPSASDLLSST
jgi:hypothetical protein